MKTLYFDCSSGISGNMAMGALLELTGDEQYLLTELKKLNVDGYRLEIAKRIKNGITGTHVNVIVDGTDEYGHVHHLEEHRQDGHGEHDYEGHEHEHAGLDRGESGYGDHDHAHHHPHRNLQDVNDIIDHSTLDEATKDLAKRIFLRVAKAESKVHHRPLEEVHFHEVGAIDSIVDIVGCAILVSRIKPDRILSGVLNEGHGFIECAHGTMSVPVPATSEIFAEGKVKFRQIDIDTELVTPTGAAIVAELAESFGYMPEMTVEKVGWGAGTKDLKIPNVLKVILGEQEEMSGDDSENCPIKEQNQKGAAGFAEKTANREELCKREAGKEEKIVVMETNLDDCSGEILGYTMEKLLENGARDVFFTPVYMKKNRPAYRLTILCMPQDIQRLQEIVFRETTSIGIRYRYEDRAVLMRETVEVETEYGKIRAKKVKGSGSEFIYPEYESLKELAESNHIPLKELYKMDLMQ